MNNIIKFPVIERKENMEKIDTLLEAIRLWEKTPEYFAVQKAAWELLKDADVFTINLISPAIITEINIELAE